MDDRIAEIVIREYQDRYLFEPNRSWPACEFDLRSYSRWAANEILLRLKERPTIGVINIIQAFMEELDRCTEVSDDWTVVRTFRVARETAEDILKLFL